MDSQIVLLYCGTCAGCPNMQTWLQISTIGCSETHLTKKNTKMNLNARNTVHLNESKTVWHCIFSSSAAKNIRHLFSTNTEPDISPELEMINLKGHWLPSSLYVLFLSAESQNRLNPLAWKRIPDYIDLIFWSIPSPPPVYHVRGELKIVVRICSISIRNDVGRGGLRLGMDLES